MIRSLLLFVILGCGLHFTATATEPAFVVFYNSGQAVKIVKGKGVSLKKGDQLQFTDQVVVPEKAQLVLVCANFSVVQLKTPGTYAIQNLLAKCRTQSTSASSAYFKYVWNQFTHAHKAPDVDPHAYMKTYGAASRGKAILTKLNTDTIYYYNGPLQIGWQVKQDLRINIYANDTNKDFLLTSKPGKSVNIDSIASVLKKSGSYYWDFEGQQSAKFKLLQIMTKKQYELVKAGVLSNVVATTPAETAYLLGYMFEEKHLLAEAARYYEKALKLMPDNQNYQRAVARFKP